MAASERYVDTRHNEVPHSFIPAPGSCRKHLRHLSEERPVSSASAPRRRGRRALSVGSRRQRHGQGAPMSSDFGADVAVIGAGVIGASSAHHLSRAGLRVAVLEAFGGPAEGSTGRSFASIRSQWADPLNIEMSWRSVRAYRSFPDDHGVDVAYRPTGYLLLVPDALWQAQLEAVDLQRAHGVPVDVLGLTAAARITPFATDGIAGATWGPADGVVDPHLATRAYLELARAAGAQVRYRCPVTAIEPDANRGGWEVTAGGG